MLLKISHCVLYDTSHIPNLHSLKPSRNSKPPLTRFLIKIPPHMYNNNSAKTPVELTAACCRRRLLAKIDTKNFSLVRLAHVVCIHNNIRVNVYRYVSFQTKASEAFDASIVLSERRKVLKAAARGTVFKLEELEEIRFVSKFFITAPVIESFSSIALSKPLTHSLIPLLVNSFLAPPYLVACLFLSSKTLFNLVRFTSKTLLQGMQQQFQMKPTNIMNVIFYLAMRRREGERLNENKYGVIVRKMKSCCSGV